MKRRMLLTILMVGMAALMLLSCTGFARPAAVAAAPRHGQNFSAVTLSPDAREALKNQKKSFSYPVPNGVNRNGRKWNPGGSALTPLTLDSDQPVIVLFVEFSDTPPGAPATRLNLGTYFDNLLFGTVYDPPEYASTGVSYPTDRTLYNYYKEVSYGYINVMTYDMPSTQGWINVGVPYSTYVHGDNGLGDDCSTNVIAMIKKAIDIADPVVDFSKYAVNGVVPSLFVVYAGTGAEWSADPNLIWSHSWGLSADPATPNGYVKDGVVIDSYAMMPELGGDLTGYTGVVSGPFPPTVGVYAHEYGHVLGLPDQYDYGYESDGTDIYSLMAGGSWNRYPNLRIFSSNSPAQLDAWSKARLGFVTPVEITSTQNLVLPPVETAPVVYKMVVPNSGGKEYFLFENRQWIGFDQGFTRFGPHGLAIYHVDEVIMSDPVAYWRPNEAENWKEFRSEGWQKATNGYTHYGISIIQADDRWDLEHAAYVPGVTLPGDLYPGSMGKTEFSSFTRPNSSSYYFWAGSDPKYGYSGVTVQNITETGTDISAGFSFVPYKAKK